MIDFDFLINGGITLITSALAGGGGYVFARKKYRVDVESAQIENLQKSLDFYEKNQENNKKILEDLQQDNIELRAENKALKEQVDTYEEALRVLHKENDSLKERVQILEDAISKIEKSLDKKTTKSSKKK